MDVTALSGRSEGAARGDQLIQHGEGGHEQQCVQQAVGRERGHEVALSTAARVGMGLCQLPDYIVQDEVASGELVELLPGFQPEPRPISAVVSSGRLGPPRVRVALGALEAQRERREG